MCAKLVFGFEKRNLKFVLRTFFVRPGPPRTQWIQNRVPGLKKNPQPISLSGPHARRTHTNQGIMMVMTCGAIHAVCPECGSQATRISVYSAG